MVNSSNNGSGNLLTRTKLFHKLIRWSFQQCDMNHTGHVQHDELYTAILLVHLQLAKYAGVAACYPPSRDMIHQLFIAADHNQSGYIEEMEFTNIMMIACTQITSRILVYYTIIICSVPYITHVLIRTLLHLDQYMGFKNDIVWLESILTYGKIVETTISFGIFFVAVPYIFDVIDTHSRRRAVIAVVPTAAAGTVTLTTTTSDTTTQTITNTSGIAPSTIAIPTPQSQLSPTTTSSNATKKAS